MVARLQTESSKQLTSLEQEIGRNQGIQQGFHADIQGQIDSFEARSAAEVAELRSKVMHASRWLCFSQVQGDGLLACFQVEGLTEIFLHLQASASSLVNSQAEAASDSIKVSDS